MKPMIKTIIAALIILGLIGATVDWYQKSSAENENNFRTAQVARGDLRLTISAARPPAACGGLCERLPVRA